MELEAPVGNSPPIAYIFDYAGDGQPVPCVITRRSRKEKSKMKNLNKRTKTILLVLGLLVIAVIAVTVFTQAGGGTLFGTTTLAITPSNPTIIVGNSTMLSLNATFPCDWSTSNSAVVSFVGSVTRVSAVTLQGNSSGSATISANCNVTVSFIKRQVTLMNTVTVVNPAAGVITPADPTIQFAIAVGSVELTTALDTYTPSCHWVTSDSTIVQLVQTDTDVVLGPSGYVSPNQVLGQKQGQVTITSTCGTQTAQTSVTVSPIALSPANLVLADFVSGYATITVFTSNTGSCHWKIADPTVATLEAADTNLIISGQPVNYSTNLVFRMNGSTPTILAVACGTQTAQATVTVR